MKPKQELESDLNREIDWWAYTQIQSKYKEHTKTYEIQREKQELNKIILESEEKLISKIYKFLLQYKMEEEIVTNTMIKWAQNFNYTIDLEKWETMWQVNTKLTLSAAYKENQLKMFYRWHLSPTRLAKIYPNNSATC